VSTITGTGLAAEGGSTDRRGAEDAVGEAAGTADAGDEAGEGDWVACPQAATISATSMAATGAIAARDLR
jgi:hypothetical protein